MRNFCRCNKKMREAEKIYVEKSICPLCKILFLVFRLFMLFVFIAAITLVLSIKLPTKTVGETIAEALLAAEKKMTQLIVNQTP